jgi:hypothetical protein
VRFLAAADLVSGRLLVFTEVFFLADGAEVFALPGFVGVALASNSFLIDSLALTTAAFADDKDASTCLSRGEY